MKIIKANAIDIDRVEQLYHEVIDYLDGSCNYPGWKKGVYPTRETAMEACLEGTLYVALDGDRTAGSIIVNQKPEPLYTQAKWNREYESKDCYVIHTFAVHPSYMKKGVGKELMEHAVGICRSQKGKCLRLDVTEQNLPAIKFYEKFGFQYADTVDLGYGAYGLPWFRLYELDLSCCI